MRTDELKKIIEEISPETLQEKWDNSGFQINFANHYVKKVLVSIEITDAVIEEAIFHDANMIVTHHPLIFGSLTKVDGNDFTGNYIQKLIKNDIAVYSTHTPFDKCQGGNNDYLAKLLHLCNTQIIESDEEGFCRVGYVDGECTVAEYVDQITTWLKIDKSFMNYTGNLDAKVTKVGLCTGAGAEFAELAFKEGCDLFITGDLKYHQAQKAKELGLNILDIGHYGSEKIFTENMAYYLRKNTDLEIIESNTDLNPFVKL